MSATMSKPVDLSGSGQFEAVWYTCETWAGRWHVIENTRRASRYSIGNTGGYVSRQGLASFDTEQEALDRIDLLTQG